MSHVGVLVFLFAIGALVILGVGAAVVEEVVRGSWAWALAYVFGGVAIVGEVFAFFGGSL